MSDQRDGGIAWTDQTWNPVRGCSRVSEGCRHCYAESVAARFSGPGMPYQGLARRSSTGDPRWTGEVRMVPEHLADPLRWKRPRRVFVNSMSDLFHEKLADEDIAAIFGVMAAAPTHTFQVLTKRAERMREWFDWVASGGVGRAGHAAQIRCSRAACAMGLSPNVVGYDTVNGTSRWTWPLPNVWIGVSVENQATADERVSPLLATPAAIRWVSYEPALGPVNFDWWSPENLKERRGLDWIVVGGESGRDPRKFEVQWARNVVRYGRRAGTAVFVKQLGANVVDRNDAGFGEDEPGAWPEAVRGAFVDYVARVEHDLDGHRDGYQGAPVRVRLADRAHGGDPEEWPMDIRVREFPGDRGGVTGEG